MSVRPINVPTAMPNAWHGPRLVVLWLCLSTPVQPPTLAGEVFVVKNDPKALARLKKSVAYLASLPLDEMVALVPVQSGIYFTDCPNCDKGTQDFGDFEWTPERPRRIRCKDCGAVYPDNPKYPDDHVLEVAAPHGVHRYPYYERPGDGYRIFFRARADYLAREYMERKCRDFARLYALTDDEEYARRAAAILLRFAEVYPGYAYHFDCPFRQKIIQPYTQNRVKGVAEYRTARWTWWAYMDISLDLLEAYDHLKAWPHLSGLAGGRAPRVIEHDLLGAMTEFVLGFDETYGNMSPGMWRRIISSGRVLHRPEWVHEAVRRFQKFLRTRFLYDGHWMETAPSYCSQVIGGLQVVLDTVKGYSDPPGYVDPTDGRHFRRLDLAVDTPQYALALRALLRPRLPDGRLLPVNDTWWTNARSPRKTMEPVLLPGLGVAVLGGGATDRQLHVHLNFTSGRQHKHDDALSFGLFAFGKELFPDIGYTHTKYRCWAASTMSHNTVVVDGKGSLPDPDWTGNRLRAFAVAGNDFQVAEAESVSAYAGLAREYRRTLVTVGTDSSDCYIVDVFRVAGGRQHDYLLHGSADDDSQARLSGARLHPFAGTLLNPGVTFTPPVGESSSAGREGAYGFVHDLRVAAVRSAVALDLRLTATPGLGTRSWILPEPGTRVYVGEAPSVRRARNSDSLLDKYQAPFVCVRRQGPDLTSTFVVVHEPVNGSPHLLRPPRVDRRGSGLLVTVDRGDLGRDYTFIASRDPTQLTFSTPDGPLTVTARYAFARVRAGRVTKAHLAGGSLLKLLKHTLHGQRGWRGAVRGVTRRRTGESRGFFEAAEPVPPSAAGLTLLVTHADDSVQAYELVEVAPAPGGGVRLFVREDPGFELTPGSDTRKVCYPLRRIPGVPTGYRILAVSG